MSAAFVFLIPLYFIYHWLARLEFTPRFLGGYSNESSAIVLVGAVIFGMRSLIDSAGSGRLISRIEFAYFANLSYFFLIILIQVGLETSLGVSASQVAALLQLLAVFVVFRFANFEAVNLRRVLFACVFIISIFVYQAAENDVLDLFLGSIDDTKGATYQGLARSLLMTVYMAVPFLKSRTARILNYSNATLILFILGARSEVVALLLFVYIVHFCESERKIRSVSVVIVVLLMMYNLSGYFMELLPDNRILAIFEVTSDASYQHRAGQISFAISQIIESPFFGAYGSYTALGGSGEYAHNLLSAWVDLGIMGFALHLLVLLMVGVWYFPAFDNSAPGDTLFNRRLLSIGAAQFMVTLFLLLTSKPFSDVTTAALLGITGQLYSRRRWCESKKLKPSWLSV